MLKRTAGLVENGGVMTKSSAVVDQSPLLPRGLRKIVVVRALHIGDLLDAVPALRSLRRAFPLAEITLVSLPWAGEEFVGRFPYVDRFLEFPGYPGMLDVDVSWPRTRAFVEASKRYGFELAIQMHGDGTGSNPFTALLGASCSVGFQREGYQPEAGQPRVTYAFPYPDGEQEILRVILFGSADPRRWAPLNRQLNPIVYKAVDCSPCLNWRCPIDHRCMTQITPADVLREARNLLR